MPELRPGDREQGCEDQQNPDIELYAWDDLVGERGRADSGQEEQRVAGEEEADQQPRLSEDDREHTDQAERRDELGGVERVDGELLAEGEGHGTWFHGQPAYRAGGPRTGPEP